MLLLGIAIQDWFSAGTNKADSDSARNCRFVVHCACLHYVECSLFDNLYCTKMAIESRKRKTVSINEKMRLLKEVDMNVGSQKSIAERFGISTSVLSSNSKLC